MLIDGFTFYNELDLLNLRLETLANAVDKFIIVEMGITHSGVRKPYVLADRLDQLPVSRDKIVYVPLYNWPRVDPRHEAHRWILENYQRNCIARGLDELGARDSDVVLVSDLDEIPDPASLRAAIDALKHKRFAVFAQAYKKYFVNAAVKGMENCPLWLGTVATHVGTLRSVSANTVRRGDSDRAAFIWTNGPLRIDTAYLNPAGWHFTYFGGAIAVGAKLENIVEGQGAHQPKSFFIPKRSRHNYTDGRTDEVLNWLAKSDVVIHKVKPFSMGGLAYLPKPLLDDPRAWESLWWYDQLMDSNSD